MSELPKGWVLSSIGEACLIENGLRKPISLKERANCQGVYPYYGATGIIDYLDSYTHEGEYVLIGEDGANLLSKSKALAFIADGQYWVNNHAHTLRSLAGSPNQYLERYFNSLSLERWVTGSAQPKLTKKNLESIPYPLAPLAEQKRIVEKLDEVLAQVDTIKARLDGIPDLLKRFRQSVLFNATSGAISKNWRELNSPLPTCKDEVVKKVFIEWCKSKEAEFLRKGKLQKNEKWKEKFPTPDFGEVAVSCWNAINLSSVAEVIDPNPSHRMPKYIDDGLPFISSENIVSLSCIDFVKGKKIQEEELVKQKTRYEVRDGTFAFTRIGTIGKSVLLPLPHSYGISHAMAVVNPFQSLMDSRFLILAMNCKSILSQAHEGVQSVGVPDLGIGKMKSFIIPLPSIEEQKEIVRLVDQYFAFADTIEAQVKKAQARVDNLTQSILATAFRGELVPQNDDDESAEVLLKRIAQARKEADALAKAAKKAGKKKS